MMFLLRIREKCGRRWKLAGSFFPLNSSNARAKMEARAIVSAFEVLENVGENGLKIEIEYATSEGEGSIVIKNRRTLQVICRRETNKTEA